MAACVTGVILIVLWAPPVVAFENYSDGCDACHGDFDSGTYTSNKDATNWGTDLMTGHLSFITGPLNCNACHTSSGFSPVATNLSADAEKPQGCVGCHGRVADESGICAFGAPDNDGEHCDSAAGLRNVHNTAGITTCFGCHTNEDGTGLVGENELPFNYGLTNIDLGSPCVGENKFGATGLDNDGDGAVDAADTDCSPTNDSDGDGVPDDEDAFPNDPNETVDTDSDGIGNNADTDDDGDGMPDDFELANGLDPLNAADADADADGDGFTNLEEFQAGTDPQDADDFPAKKKVPIAIFVILGEDEN